MVEALKDQEDAAKQTGELFAESSFFRTPFESVNYENFYFQLCRSCTLMFSSYGSEVHTISDFSLTQDTRPRFDHV